MMPSEGWEKSINGLSNAVTTSQVLKYLDLPVDKNKLMNLNV
jgi:hypothetical protein